MEHIPHFAMYNVHPYFWPKLSGEKSFHFNFLIQLFIFRNKTDYRIPGYYFAYRYHSRVILLMHKHKKKN